MSLGFGIVTILGCLDEGERLANLKPEGWQGNGLEQEYFASLQRESRQCLDRFDKTKLQSFATTAHAEVLAKMAEWKMRLNPVPDGGPGTVYMLSQLKEHLKWIKAGKKVTGRPWPEFILNGDAVHIFHFGVGMEPVIGIDLENGDSLFLQRYNHPINSFFELMPTITTIDLVKSKICEEGLPGGVQIPCISADLEPDLKWMIGMENDDYVIGYAQQKILFGMNQEGFAVREEAAVSMTRGIHIEPMPYILSPKGESFLFWRLQAGTGLPISMFWFTKDDFKDPGDLNKIVE
jgi:hypothetical protein